MKSIFWFATFTFYHSNIFYLLQIRATTVRSVSRQHMIVEHVNEAFKLSVDLIYPSRSHGHRHLKSHSFFRAPSWSPSQPETFYVSSGNISAVHRRSRCKQAAGQQWLLFAPEKTWCTWMRWRWRWRRQWPQYHLKFKSTLSLTFATKTYIHVHGLRISGDGTADNITDVVESKQCIF